MIRAVFDWAFLQIVAFFGVLFVGYQIEVAVGTLWSIAIIAAPGFYAGYLITDIAIKRARQ